MVTPLFRAGGRSKHNQESRLEDGTFVTIDIKVGYVFQTRAVLQTDGLPRTLPRPEGRGYRKCRPSGGKRLSDAEDNTKKRLLLAF